MVKKYLGNFLYKKFSIYIYIYINIYFKIVNKKGSIQICILPFVILAINFFYMYKCFIYIFIFIHIKLF